MPKLTEAHFSMLCSYIAKNAAAWAGDILTLPERHGREADPANVARFTDEIRGKLDRLDEMAGRVAASCAAQSQIIAVPDGWQLVPKKLTPEMAAELNLTGTFAAAAMQARYDAALAVAPKRGEAE